MFQTRLSHTAYTFADLRELLGRASAQKSGDELAGLAARSAGERQAARSLLADVPLKTLLDEPLIPYEADEVTRLIVDGHDAPAFAPIANLSVGELRDWLLSSTPEQLVKVRGGLTPEMVSAVCKLMRNQDLMLIASRCEVVTRFRNTLGLRGHFSTRLQPNHPTDDPRGVLASCLDGLMFGAGDAVIGINPALDSVDACTGLLHLLDDLRQTLRISHPDLRPDPRDQHLAGHRKRRSGGPGVSEHRRNAARQPGLRYRPGTARRGARRRPQLETGGPRAQRDVFRDRAGQRSEFGHPPRRRSTDLRGAGLRRGAALPAAAGQYGGGFYRPRVPLPTASRLSARDSKTTARASCWACRWAWTCATPTTPRPTRTIWTCC